MKFIVKRNLKVIYSLCLGMALSMKSWGIDDPNIYLFNGNDSLSLLSSFSEESDSEDNSQIAPENQSQEEEDTLTDELVRDLQSFHFDAQDYILCHTYLKNTYLKCHEIYKALLLMRENVIMAGSELATPEQRRYFDIYFRSHADAIPLILRINSSESLLGDDNKEVVLPEGHSILIPTVKPIVEAMQLLRIITVENRIEAKNIIDAFIPKIVDILFHVSMESDKIWSLLHGTAKRVEATQDKLLGTFMPDI